MNQLKKVLLCMLMLVFASSLALANAPDPILWNWETDFHDTGEVNVNGDPVYDYILYNEDYEQDAFEWTYGVGSESTWLQYGEVEAADPWVRQSILNNSSANWSDWHVRVNGGFINPASIKVYNRTLGEANGMWVWTDPGDLKVENINGTDYVVGFDAHTVTSSGKHVLPGQVLRVEFYYEAFVIGTSVSLEQYPTDTYPIPEPGTMVALISGLAGFGVFARKRMR